MVILSISMSLGVGALAGIKATLIITEVIPFLVLAIGVDNIYILVETFESIQAASVDEQIIETMKRVGSSVTMASLSETFAFLLGMSVAF